MSELPPSFFVGLRKGNTYVGPKRSVVAVWKIKRKRGEPGGGANWVIKLECGHRYTRNLWRNPDDVRCCDCAESAKPTRGPR